MHFEDQAQLHDCKREQEEEEEKISGALTVFNTVRHEELMRWNGTVCELINPNDYDTSNS